MRRSTALVIPVIGCGLLAGCGGGATRQTATQRTTTNAASAPNPAAQLEGAVRTALNENGRLSTYVLWNNTIPSWASHSTRGPALAALAASAAGRQKEGVRVRSLSANSRIMAIQLDPSYSSATATVRNDERVALYRHGQRERTVTVDERDQIVLHRVGQTTRFVVWEVRPQR